jgi:DNA mismatch repair protein MutS2
LQRRADENAAARPRVTRTQSELLTKTLEQMRRDLGIKDRAAEAPADDGVMQPGDRVRIHSLRQDGTVVEDYGDTVQVAIGPMKTVVKKSDLERRGRNVAEKREARLQRRESSARRHAEDEASGDAKLQAAARTMSELDVRGKRYVDAEPIVDRWIDEAVLAGNTPLRLIHGKGTGMLGRGLQEFLRAHPAVKSVRYGHADEGSGGVTIIELE